MSKPNGKSEIQPPESVKKWSHGHSSEGYSVISHEDYGDIAAWNDITAAALALVLNEGVREAEPLPTEELGEAWMDGWFEGFRSARG